MSIHISMMLSHHICEVESYTEADSYSKWELDGVGLYRTSRIIY